MEKEQIELVENIRRNPYIVANAVGFRDVKPNPHNEWMREIVFGHDDYTLMAHRGSYKSSCLSICIALIMVLFPWLNIIFLRKADNDVSEMIRMVRKALESHFFQSLSKLLWNQPLILIESTASSITTSLYVNSSGASQLLGIGLKSSITGKHADIVITDDICNVNDRKSKAERDNTKAQYQELQNVCNRGGRIINTGTKWHKDDVFTLMKNIHIYTYKQTGLITDQQAQILRDSMTPSLFACNYELRIVASEDVIFTDPITGANPSFVEQGVAHVDASYGGEDFTAFTIMKYYDGKFYILGKLWHKHIENCYDDIIILYQRFMCGKMPLEDNGDKGFVARDLKGRGVRTYTYHESMNKYIKISTYLKAIWKYVVFVDGTDPEYIDQICDYTEDAEHDDAPDSAACLARLLYRKANKPEYKSIFEAERKRAQV